jgi:TP901 family phage tail tape measure protein
MRTTAGNLSAYENDIKAGKVSQSSVESRLTPTSGASASESQIKSRGAATEELVARQRALTAAEGESASAERTMAQAMAQSAGNMRSNGALTNEFIEEAKRGTVTVRELGQQVTGTIAKFGGWILAGSAVYFAFDALKFLKAGAIDATSGVTQMSRVIQNLNVHKATEEVSELAGEFNLPVSTVTETAFLMGKAYHNQAEALLSTKAALYAVKVGEIDAGTASRYLISIIQGFHLPAKDTIGLFNELLAAQKHYAIDLPTLMAGVGRAGGAFRAAGGDVHGLIALITTLQHVSGQTGNVIGTAIQRSPHFLGMPKNQSILEQFGINPATDAKHSIEDVYGEAIQAAQGKSGTVQREIAEGLFGPQYGARVGIFLLQNKKLLAEVGKTTSPAQTHHTAEEQLKITLEKTSEQITKIGVSLERLGLGLASGHLLDSLGLILKILNGSLEIVNDLVGAFDKLPQPVQQMLAYLIQASLLIKTFRRFNVGESIAGGPGATPSGIRGGAASLFGYGSQTAFAKEAREAMVNEEKDLQSKLSKIQNTRGSLQGRETLALNRQGVAEGNLLAAPAGSAEAATASKQAAAARAEVDATYQRIYALALDEESVATRLAAVQDATAGSRRAVIGGLNAQATISEYQKLGYGVPAGVAGAAEETTTKTAGGLTSLGTKLGGVKTGLGKMGGAFNELIGRAGSLLFAAFAVSFLSEQLINEANKVSDEFEKISTLATSAESQAAKLKGFKKGAQSGETFADRLTNLFTEHTSLGPIPIPEFGLGPGKGIGEERAEVEAGEAKNIEATLRLQKRARKEGKAVPLRYVGEITKDIEALKTSGKTRAEIREAEALYNEELEHSAASPHQEAELAKAKSLLSQQKVDSAKNRNLVADLQGLKSTQIAERLAAALGQVGGAEGVPFSADFAHKAALIYQGEVQRIGSATDAKSLGELQAARQQYFTGVTQAVSSELATNLDLAKTPEQRSQAYQQALSRYRQFSRSSDPELQKQQQVVKQLKDHREALKRSEEQAAQNFIGPVAPGAPQTSKALKNLDEQIKSEGGKLKELTQQQSEKQRYIRDIIQKLREEQFQAESAIRQAREGALEALTSDPIQQLEEKLNFLGKEISRAISVYGKESQQVLQLIGEQRNARSQLIQAQLGRIQAEGNLASAGIIEQVPKEKAALSGRGGLLDQLRFEQQHRNAFDPKAIIELEAQVKQAQAQLAHDVEAEATQLADAAFGIREAKANAASNPAEAARIAVEKAKYDVVHAQTPLEKLSAQQSLIQAVAAKRDAVANARVESIQYEASIAKITTTEEITQLETLLGTYKLSLTARRHLREQIHSLKSQLANEGQGFDLNVGDFTLPTSYDIRRAVLGGGSSKGATVNQTNHFQIDNHSSDPNVVGKAIGQALGGAADSAARSAGVA